MKKLIYVFSILVLVSCSSDKIKITEINSNIGIKYSIEIYYLAVNESGEIVKKETLKSKYTNYNRAGDEMDSYTNKADGSLDYKAIYKYDDNDNRIELGYYRSDGTLRWKNRYVYDKRGNQIKHYNYKSDASLNWQYTYGYNDNDNKIQRNKYDGDFSLEMKSIYKYDDQNNEIEASFFCLMVV